MCGLEGGCKGPLFEDEGRLHRAVRKAWSERLRMQRRDRMFAARDGRRFRTPQRRCSKLAVGGETVLETLLTARAEHFQKLARLRAEMENGFVGDTVPCEW